MLRRWSRYFARTGGERRKNALVGGGWWHGGGSGETERGRPCKGHHSNCPGLPFIPFVWPWGALPRLSPPTPPSLLPPRLVASTASSFPCAGSSKSFLRLIFPSNLHAAVIKGLGRGTSSGASTDAAGDSGGGEGGRKDGRLVLVLAVRTPSKQWRVSWVPGSRTETWLVKFQRIRRARYTIVYFLLAVIAPRLKGNARYPL